MRSVKAEGEGAEGVWRVAWGKRPSRVRRSWKRQKEGKVIEY